LGRRAQLSPEGGGPAQGSRLVPRSCRRALAAQDQAGEAATSCLTVAAQAAVHAAPRRYGLPGI
jgi:hypothetical protein